MIPYIKKCNSIFNDDFEVARHLSSVTDEASLSLNHKVVHKYFILISMQPVPSKAQLILSHGLHCQKCYCLPSSLRI